MVLGIHDEHIRLLARVEASAKDRLDIIDRDIRTEARFLSVAVHRSAHVGRQLIGRGTARIVAATHTVAVLHIVVPDLSRVSGVALARIVTDALQLTS